MTIRDFSRRYSVALAPVMRPSLNNISRYFPNLELLSFLVVLALPKDSKMGDDSRICSVTRFGVALFAAERYWVKSLVVSVFPAPDSPLISMTCRMNS